MGVPSRVTLCLLVVSIVAVLAPAVVLASGSTRTRRRAVGVGVAAGLGVWLAATTLIATGGGYRFALANTVPAIGLAMLVALACLGIGVTSSPDLRRALGDPTVQARLLGLQVWRVAGVVFLVLLGLGQLPALFAVPAGLGDVFVGLTAPLVARSMQRRGLTIAWNLFGLADLGLAVFLGVTTNPGRLQLFPTSPPSDLLTAFPLALVPTFVVPLSVGLHVVSLRYILSTGEQRSGAQSTLALS